MILVFEPVWTGTYHAPGNSVTIQTIAYAYPDQQIVVMAEATHLAELMADAAFAALPNIEVRPVTLSPHFRYRPHMVSIRRGWRELTTMAAALRGLARGEPVLLVLISASSTAIFAAALLARLARRRFGVLVGLHGNLNDAIGWRSRNPVSRALDLHAALNSAHGGAVRFLVLEPAIARAMAERLPLAARRTDVLPLPVNQSEIVLDRGAPFQPPLRIGLVGQATESKGITTFLDLAGRLRGAYPGRVAFHLVGKRPEGDDPARYAPLEEPAQSTPLSRAEFQRRLSRLHFVCLPMQSGYYSLSASGALIDAITWLRPIIATPIPAVRDLFEEFGDIGYLCPDAEAMHKLLTRLARDMDADRYAAQVARLRIVRESRTPQALADRFRALAHAGFPGLI